MSECCQWVLHETDKVAPETRHLQLRRRVRVGRPSFHRLAQPQSSIAVLVDRRHRKDHRSTEERVQNVGFKPQGSCNKRLLTTYSGPVAKF